MRPFIAGLAGAVVTFIVLLALFFLVIEPRLLGSGVPAPSSTAVATATPQPATPTPAQPQPASPAPAPSTPATATAPITVQQTTSVSVTVNTACGTCPKPAPAAPAPAYTTPPRVVVVKPAPPRCDPPREPYTERREDGSIWLVIQQLDCSFKDRPVEPAPAPAPGPEPTPPAPAPPQATPRQCPSPTTEEVQTAIGLSVVRVGTEFCTWVWRSVPKEPGDPPTRLGLIVPATLPTGFIITVHRDDNRILVVLGTGQKMMIKGATFRFVNGFPPGDAVYSPCQLLAKERAFGQSERPSFTVEPLGFTC